MTPRPLLHLEGAALLAITIFGYHQVHGGWLFFAALFLVPDVSMAGYALNTRIGAMAYNAVHTTIGPIVLGAIAFTTAHHTTLLIAVIWLAHIGLDRMLGFGLKFPTQFKDTHLSPTRLGFIA